MIGHRTAGTGRTLLLPAKILATGRWSGGRRITSREVIAEAMPERDAQRIEARIGIAARRWAEPETTVIDMAAEALLDALDRGGLEASALRRIIVTCSTGGALLIPGTAIDVAQRVGIRDQFVDTFDLANSCNGFMSAFDLASRAIATGDGPVAIVAVEQFSRFVRPEEPRCYVIFGDAAVATILTPSTRGDGLVGSGFRAVPARGERIDVRHPARTGTREYIDFGTLDSEFLTGQALAALRGAIDHALRGARVDVRDLNWVLPHQPNAEMLRRFAAGLAIDEDRLVPILAEHGSVGVVAIPLSLDALLRSGRVSPGDHVLMASVGSGTVAGALVYRVAS